MRWTSALVAALALSASCSGDNAPPTAPGKFVFLTLTAVWVLVVDDSGFCLPGATVELLRPGQETQSIPQVTPCDVWDGSGGAVFRGLPAGVEVTVRSSVAGYAPAEKTVMTSRGGQSAVELMPARIQ